MIHEGRPVLLITAVVIELPSNDGTTDQLYLAPHCGFWPPGKANRPLNGTPFRNPYVQHISKEQLLLTTNDQGEQVYRIE